MYKNKIEQTVRPAFTNSMHGRGVKNFHLIIKLQYHTGVSEGIQYWVVKRPDVYNFEA